MRALRGQKREPVPEHQRIFSHGLQFHEAALRCLETGADATFLPTQSTVLLALTVELYLKAAVSSEGGAAQAGGHRLDKGFERLSAPLRDEIVRQYKDRCGRDAMEDLVSFSPIFVKFRYSYELQGAHSVDLTSLGHLAASLYVVWITRHPEACARDVLSRRITSPDQGIPIFR